MEDAKKEAKLQKLYKQVEETFVDSVRSAKNDDLKNLVISLSNEIEDVAEKKKSDTTLSGLKEKVADLNGGYNDLIKDKKNRIALILLTLESRGKL